MEISDLISKCQKVVVEPNAVQGNHKQLCEIDTTQPPLRLRVSRISKQSPWSHTCRSPSDRRPLHFWRWGEKYAQKVSGLGQHSQVRPIHLSRGLWSRRGMRWIESVMRVRYINGGARTREAPEGMMGLGIIPRITMSTPRQLVLTRRLSPKLWAGSKFGLGSTLMLHEV